MYSYSYDSLRIEKQAIGRLISTIPYLLFDGLRADFICGDTFYDSSAV
jgi:hypothetical protein